MILSLDAVVGYSLGATDEEIGRIVDVYFDDRHWTVRYLVVDTGGWLGGREVLISPVSLAGIDPAARAIRATLTRAQVEGSPRVDTHQPVSRQAETAFSRYYGYAPYWTGPYAWGAAASPELAPRLRDPGGLEPTPMEEEILAQDEDRDPHLRSAREVMDYAVAATDGEVGHLEDALVDDRTWTIRWLVVDTTNWWPGGHVLLSPEWARTVSWDESRIAVDLPRERIRSAPAFDPGQPVDRALEARLAAHYGRPAYWEQGERVA
jgi:hypothetical protein